MWLGFIHNYRRKYNVVLKDAVTPYRLWPNLKTDTGSWKPTEGPSKTPKHADLFSQNHWNSNGEGSKKLDGFQNFIILPEFIM
jgi:hypothetical protein